MFSVVNLSIRSFNIFIKALSPCLKILWNVEDEQQVIFFFKIMACYRLPSRNIQPLKENHEYN